jgi:mono/diheme cytochrome c family protein
MHEERAMLGLAAALVLALVPSAGRSAETQATKPGAAAPAASRKQIERGRYMMVVGSCNDCHTSGFAARNGDVPERNGSWAVVPSVSVAHGGRPTRPICG